MVYMFSTRKGCFSIILGAMHHESSRLSIMHKISHKDANLHVLSCVPLHVQESHLRWPLGPSVTLRLFVIVKSCYMPSNIVLWSIGPKLHAMRMICLLMAATPAWVINTIPFTISINYFRYSGSFDILQAKVKRLLSVGPVRPGPCALDKHYSARGGPIYKSFMYFT